MAAPRSPLRRDPCSPARRWRKVGTNCMDSAHPREDLILPPPPSSAANAEVMSQEMANFLECSDLPINTAIRPQGVRCTRRDHNRVATFA